MAGRKVLFTPGDDGFWFRDEPTGVEGMMFPVRCTMCQHVYDLGQVTMTGRYADCSVWQCPGCRVTVDDRPVGWGAHHYVELDRDGYEKRRQ